MIDVLGDDVEETTTFAAILTQAFYIAPKCVIQPPHFGGKCRVGERGMLGVAVIESPPGRSITALCEMIARKRLS